MIALLGQFSPRGRDAPTPWGVRDTRKHLDNRVRPGPGRVREEPATSLAKLTVAYTNPTRISPQADPSLGSGRGRFDPGALWFQAGEGRAAPLLSRPGRA